jgi:hypothetical protein
VVEMVLMLHMMSVVSKAIVLAYNSGEKRFGADWPCLVRGIPFSDLMQYLSAGVKSDVANAFLEATESSSDIWKIKFDYLNFESDSLIESIFSRLNISSTGNYDLFYLINNLIAF